MINYQFFLDCRDLTPGFLCYKPHIHSVLQLALCYACNTFEPIYVDFLSVINTFHLIRDMFLSDKMVVTCVVDLWISYY